jgi:uracil phosphoribosyltransferase
MLHPKLSVVDHPLARVLMTRIRDRETTSEVFRALLDTLTSVTLLQAMLDLTTEEVRVATPLMETEGSSLSHPVAFVPILRAGLGMVPAAQRLLPEACVRHLGLYRNEDTLEPVAYYNKLDSGSLVGHQVYILDPMLATAGTASAVIRALQVAGASTLHFVALLGAPEGLKLLAEEHPEIPITLTSLDERLTTVGEQWPAGYILPGLGDAGDRQFDT